MLHHTAACATFKPPNYINSLKNSYITCFLLPDAPCVPTLGSFEAIIIAQWPQKSLDNTGQSHRISTHTGCYRLQNFWCQESFPHLPKYHNFTISGVSAARLKEFHCIWKKYSTFSTCVLAPHRAVTNTRNSTNNFKNLNICTTHELQDLLVSPQTFTCLDTPSLHSVADHFNIVGLRVAGVSYGRSMDHFNIVGLRIAGVSYGRSMACNVSWSVNVYSGQLVIRRREIWIRSVRRW